jgi:ubiquinone/menaquinone biosynthesis C-methylase UbiE
MVELQAVNTTYEPFSQEPEYVEVNRGFVNRVSLAHVHRFLDIATGAGTVSRMLLEASPKAHLNGTDLDPVQIELSTKEFKKLGYEVRKGFDLTDDIVNGKPVITLGVASGDDLRFPDNTFDSATIANAIHMMPDKSRFLNEVRRVLKPGGLFGFNQAFYAGSYPKGTEKHLIFWIKEATIYIDKLNQQLKVEGKPPIKRVHGTTRGAFQNRWSTPQEWVDTLTQHGYKVKDVNERTIELDERCLAAVGAYGGFAEVLMSGYPVEAASMALQATAGASLRAMNLNALPRNWLEVWATKE